MEHMEPTFVNDSSNFVRENSSWYQAKEYNRFWTVYYDCMLHVHNNAIKQSGCLQKKIAASLSGMIRPPRSKRSSRSSLTSEERKRDRNRRRNKKKKKRKRLKEQLKNPPANVFVLSDDDTLQVKLREQLNLHDTPDIEEEYLAFLEQSVTHRIKWNLNKEMKKQKENDSDVERDMDTTKQEHPDKVREREMQKLYGDSAAQIHGMETAMQLSFDRISTLYRPALWPNIPLKLSF